MHASKRMIAGLAIVAVLLVSGVALAATNFFQVGYTVTEPNVNLEIIGVDSTDIRPGLADCPDFISNARSNGTEYDMGIVLTAEVTRQARIVISMGPDFGGSEFLPTITYKFNQTGLWYYCTPMMQENSCQFLIDVPLVSGEPKLVYVWVTHHSSTQTLFAAWAFLN